MRVLIVDGANVVGSRPDGWWRDRAGAAARLHGELEAAELGFDAVVLVLEGAARRGVPANAPPGPRSAGPAAEIYCSHAPGEGDDAIVAEVREWRAAGAEVRVVTADNALRARSSAAGGESVGPTWLWDQLRRH